MSLTIPDARERRLLTRSCRVLPSIIWAGTTRPQVCDEKLLAAAWHGRDRLACGGVDSKLHVFSQTDSASLIKQLQQ